MLKLLGLGASLGFARRPSLCSRWMLSSPARSIVPPRALHFLLSMRPYYRQVAGELILGSISGAIMNTASVLPQLLVGRAIDEVLAFRRG